MDLSCMINDNKNHMNEIKGLCSNKVNSETITLKVCAFTHSKLVQITCYFTMPYLPINIVRSILIKIGFYLVILIFYKTILPPTPHDVQYHFMLFLIKSIKPNILLTSDYLNWKKKVLLFLSVLGYKGETLRYWKQKNYKKNQNFKFG